MKRDDFKKKKDSWTKLLEIFFFFFFILSLFSYFSVCFLMLKLLCVKEEKKTAVVTFWPCVQCNIENISLLFHIYSLCW